MSWIRKSFTRKLALLFIGTLAVTMSLAGILITRRVRSQLIEELSVSLHTQGRLIISQTNPVLLSAGPNLTLQKLAMASAQAVGARITFIDPSGVVLADSDVVYSDLAKVENHLNRPEIQNALRGHDDWAIRHSHTVGRDLLYESIVIPSKLGPLGVVRLAINLDSVQQKLDLARQDIWHMSLAAGVAGLFIVMWISWSIRRRLEELSDTAQRLSKGEYQARTHLKSQDEFGTLAGTLNHLAEKIQLTVDALSRDKTQLAGILFNMVESVVAVDQTGKILAVNPAMAVLFGIEERKVQGLPFMDILRHSQLNDLIRLVLKDGGSRVEEVKTFDPVERLFEAHAVPLQVEGRQQGALLVLHDVTRLRQLEQIRRDFVANVSHELRTPLAAIQGFAETLKLGAVDDKAHRMEFLTGIETHTVQMTRLIEDLLDLSAIESGKRLPQKTYVSLTELAQEVVSTLHPFADRNKVALQLNINNDVPSLMIDRVQIRQVLTNLIENAIKFNNKNGSVEISFHLEGGFVETLIKDTGVGIPKGALPRVFERFFRVDKARSRDMGGTGLGLSIVKHIIEAHHGLVGVRSEEGRGSVFFFKLPL